MTCRDYSHNPLPDCAATRFSVTQPVWLDACAGGLYAEAMSDAPWSPERTLSLEQARAVLQRQFPALAPHALVALGAGWDNTVFLLNDHWVFRFPRRQLALELQATEWAQLSWLQGKLPVQVPEPVFQGQPDRDFAWPFVGYRVVPGQTACRARLTEAERTALAPLLGETLRMLHALQPPAVLPLPGDSLRRLDLAWRWPKLQAYLAQAQAQGWCDLDAAALQRLPEQTPPGRPQVLVHGDLYVRHLVVTPQRQLQGLIDWGDVHRGDPACDLGLVLAFLPPRGQQAFWEAYGAPRPEDLYLACFRAIFSCLAIGVYAFELGDADLLREGHRGLHACGALLRQPGIL